MWKIYMILKVKIILTNVKLNYPVMLTILWKKMTKVVIHAKKRKKNKMNVCKNLSYII